MTIVFQLIKHTVGLRVSKEEEIAGLDIKEHGLTSSYADFITFDNTGDLPVPNTASESIFAAGSAALQAPAEATPPAGDGGGFKLTKVTIITRQNKLNELMHELNAIGITGITITNVLGCGTQKGSFQYYRGVPMDMSLLPKVKIEIVISRVPVEKVIETAKKVLYTGHIGDGKVFLYDIENVIKIRTGEEGPLALQDTPE